MFDLQAAQKAIDCFCRHVKNAQTRRCIRVEALPGQLNNEALCYHIGAQRSPLGILIPNDQYDPAIDIDYSLGRLRNCIVDVVYKEIPALQVLPVELLAAIQNITDARSSWSTAGGLSLTARSNIAATIRTCVRTYSWGLQDLEVPAWFTDN